MKSSEGTSKTRKARILWISPRWPLPPDDGAKRATFNLLSRMESEELEVDLLVLFHRDREIDEKAAAQDLGVSRVFTIDRKSRTIRSVFRSVRDPITYAPFHSPDVLAGWRELSSREQWDGYVYDGLHAAALFCEDGLYTPPPNVRFTAYRSHNVEYHLWEREAERAGVVKQWPLKWQGALVERFERSVIESVDLNYAISTEDESEYRALAPRSHVEFLPVGFDFAHEATGKSEAHGPGIELLYVGRLDWPPNRSGLEWFLREVWPAVVERRSDLRLSIVGSGSSDWLKPYLALPGLDFHGRVPDVAPFYDRADAAIIPVFYGSGVRVKALESCFHARTCVSTSVGVGGTGLLPSDHYLNAETPKEWIEVIVGLQASQVKTLGDACHRFLKSKYDSTRIAAGLREDLLRLAAKRPDPQ